MDLLVICLKSIQDFILLPNEVLLMMLVHSTQYSEIIPVIGSANYRYFLRLRSLRSDENRDRIFGFTMTQLPYIG